MKTQCIMVKIPLTKIKIPKKRTVKKGRMKHLTLYKNLLEKKKNSISQCNDTSKIDLNKMIFQYIEKEGIVQPKDYEPTLDMFSLVQTQEDYIKEMALHLHILSQDWYHLKRRETVCLKEVEPRLKLLAQNKYEMDKKAFIKQTKEIGKGFFIPFKKMYDLYKSKKCLMLIFVEVLKSLMIRETGEIKRPKSSRVSQMRNLMHGMISQNGCSTHNYFFLRLEPFEELFNKTYSQSLMACFESPGHQSSPNDNSISWASQTHLE